ncbi:MAG: carbohydrate ABC transporter permease [Fimbriimonadaceae bacterium]
MIGEELATPSTARSVEFARRTNRATVGERLGRFGVWLLLAAGCILFMLPMYLMMVMAFKSQSEIAVTDSWAWPQVWTLENFREVLTNPNVSFLRFALNTVFIVAISTFGVLFSSALVAYPFARMQFLGKNRLFILLLATMMLPGIITMIPTYVMFSKIHWVNTYLPLTVPAFFGGGAFNIFLLRQFFMGIPRELDEAALIDGATHWTIFSRLIMPLSGPALATVGIFTLVWGWRDFMGPLLYLNDPEMQTLEVGLATFQAMNNERWHLLMAGSLLVTIPLIVIFFVGQKFFVKGIQMSGIK